MFGAICGDVLGSTYEFHPTKVYGFPMFPSESCVTDDTVLTAAVASALLRGRSFEVELKDWYGASSRDNFGAMFQAWAISPDGTVGTSAGNGACMRVSAIPLLSPSLAAALECAESCTRTSHDHPGSVRAAMATVAAKRLAHEGWSQADMAAVVGQAFGYDLATPLAATRRAYAFEPTAEMTVGPSLRAAVEATSFEDGMRRVISMGGDADTMAATCGGVLEAYHPVTDPIRPFVEARLPGAVREVLAAYAARVGAAPVGITPRADVPGILAKANARAGAPSRRGGALARLRGLLAGRPAR